MPSRPASCAWVRPSRRRRARSLAPKGATCAMAKPPGSERLRPYASIYKHYSMTGHHLQNVHTLTRRNPLVFSQLIQIKLTCQVKGASRHARVRSEPVLVAVPEGHVVVH